MRVNVDLERCEYHGQCVIAAPDLFELTEPDVLVWKAEPSEDQRADAEAAVDVCPTQAISIED
jgi:ferredoxin